MSVETDFVIKDQFICSNICGKTVLRKYTGEEKNVVIPEGVERIDRNAFCGYKKLQSVVIPDTVTYIDSGAFEKCSALKSVRLPDKALYLPDNTFKGCSRLTCLKSLGANRFGNIFGLSPKSEIVMPLIFPSVSLSKVKNVFYKISLTMGYLQEPALYKGNGLAGYKKFLKENRELILETAKRHGIDFVVEALSADGEAKETEEFIGIDQMRVAEAKEFFEIQNKASGVKILRYKGTEKIVDIPRVIGKTAVALVSPDAFPNDKIVRCNAKTFEKLSPAVQLNTYHSFCLGSVKFSVEQQKAMTLYFEKKRYSMLEAAIDLGWAEMTAMLLEKPMKLKEFESLLEKASSVGNTQVIAAIVEARNQTYTPKQIESIHTEEVEKELGFREKNLEEYREIFSIYKNKAEHPDDAVYSITNLKKKIAVVEIPAYIEGGAVELGWRGFHDNKIMESLIIEEGVTTIAYGVAYGCTMLKFVRIPASVSQIGEDSFLACSPNLTIHAPAGSYAEIYAKENNIPFVAE